MALADERVAGWLRQEENQYLSCPPEMAAQFDDPELRSLLGYSAGNVRSGTYSSPLEPSTNDLDIRLSASALGGTERVTVDGPSRQQVF